MDLFRAFLKLIYLLTGFIMTIASAFLVPGSPLPYLERSNPPWQRLADAMDIASQALAESDPDTIVVYSNEWMAVLDQLWQTRPHIQGIHVDHNWHEYGELSYEINIDTEYAQAIIEDSITKDIKSKGVNYDQFPVDTGTIIANNFLNPKKQYPLVIGANNAYHDWQTTFTLGEIAARQAQKLGRKIAVVSIGGLSGSFYRHTIKIEEDKIVNEREDEWNKNILKIIEQGDSQRLLELCPEYTTQAKVDMGFKQAAFVLGRWGETTKTLKYTLTNHLWHRRCCYPV